MKRAVAWLLTVGTLAGAWQLSLTSGAVSPAALAGPWEVLLAMPRVLSVTGHLSDFISTVACSLLAFGFSVPVGLLSGFAIFSLKSFARPWEFVLDFLRSIPATALVPCFLILVGIGDKTKVVIGAFSSALIIALSVIAGLEGKSRTRMTVAKLLRLNTAERFRLVDLPEVLPQVFIGLRAGSSLALILVVVTEMMIGGDRGLGRVIADMRSTDDKPLLYAAIVMTGVIGYAYNVGIRAAERTLVHWRGIAQ